MIAKVKAWLESHQKQYELLRYLIAGGLTTVLSMIISYGVCFVLADRAPLEGGLIPWVIDSINRATRMQVSIANTVSWILSVLFAFWINRGMVFGVRGGTKGRIGTELAQFAGGRLVSFFLFEQGLMLVLKQLGVSNVANRILVLVFVVVFNYVISKFWIFKKDKAA
ncbi:MAG: GtrA family protein [Clostridia bacterium]|nr:GtrA family protein [Clostridia bacterium]